MSLANPLEEVKKLCDDKEEDELATQVLETQYTLNEQEAIQILETPLKSITETNVFNDINLSRADRIKHAANILNSRK